MLVSDYIPLHCDSSASNSCRYDCFLRGKHISPDGPCYGYRPIVRTLLLLLYRVLMERLKTSNGIRTMSSGNESRISPRVSSSRTWCRRRTAFVQSSSLSCSTRLSESTERTASTGCLPSRAATPTACPCVLSTIRWVQTRWSSFSSRQK